MCDGAAGGFTLYLGKTSDGFEFDGESLRAVNFSSGQPLGNILQDKITVPQNVREGALFIKTEEKLPEDTCWRIRFGGGDRYDPESGILSVGDIRADIPVYRIFKNCYVQLSEGGALLTVICTGICGN